MNDLQDLVRMANQIAGFFSGYPEDEALPGVTDHIRDFWTPAMRRKLAAHVSRGGEGLHPLAARAMQGLEAEAA